MAPEPAPAAELRAILPNLFELGCDTYAVWSYRYDSRPGDGPIGMTEFHRCTSSTCPFRGEDGLAGWCGGGVLFDVPGVREAFPGRALWRIEQAAPLTLTPSIACSHPGCTHHGWIRDGIWVPA